MFLCFSFIGLIRNLALTSENLPVLYENQCVESLWHILNRANQESHRRGHPGGPPGYIVSVSGVHVHTQNYNFCGGKPKSKGGGGGPSGAPAYEVTQLEYTFGKILGVFEYVGAYLFAAPAVTLLLFML